MINLNSLYNVIKTAAQQRDELYIDYINPGKLFALAAKMGHYTKREKNLHMRLAVELWNGMNHDIWRNVIEYHERGGKRDVSSFCKPDILED